MLSRALCLSETSPLAIQKGNVTDRAQRVSRRDHDPAPTPERNKRSRKLKRSSPTVSRADCTAIIVLFLLCGSFAEGGGAHSLGRATYAETRTMGDSSMCSLQHGAFGVGLLWPFLSVRLLDTPCRWSPGEPPLRIARGLRSGDNGNASRARFAHARSRYRIRASVASASPCGTSFGPYGSR
jgi:hypothetical protein